jgi:hypothetical protein
VDLFMPVVPLSRQLPNFRALVSKSVEAERHVILDWSRGFLDRDGKFVVEFQTTFNSSFWELYLNAALKSLGFSLDFTQTAPDFSAARDGMNVAAVGYDCKQRRRLCRRMGG